MTHIQKIIFYARKFILFFILLFFGFVLPVYAVDVTLQWNPCSEPDLAGYRLFSREKGQAYDYSNPSIEVVEAWCNLNNLDENKTYYFVVRAFDINGIESNDSNEVCLKAATMSDQEPPIEVIFEAHFDFDNDGFNYIDDAFRCTSQPSYADGARIDSGGFIGGALQITLGRIDNADILDMSAGWRQDFVLDIPTEVVLSFRYKLTQAPDYEFDELSQVLVSIDHILYGKAPNDYVVEIRGDGNGGTFESTGWQLFEVNLGILDAGNHTLTIGGYNNKKTYHNESTQILIDDVLITSFDRSNQAPYVDAGFDQTITLSEDSVFLNGTMMDDGLPDPPARTITIWRQVNGQGTVDFSDARAVNTHASFSEAGRYVLELIAYDGEFISSDRVAITVTP